MGSLSETSLGRFTERHPVVSGVILAAATNKLVSEAVWGMERESKIHMLPFHGPATAAAGLVFPGMGNSGDGSQKMAHQLAEVLPEQPWAYLKYDNSRILKIETIANLLTKYMDHTESEYLNAITSSMGIMILLEAAKIAGIPIGVLFMDSSPSHMRDGHGSKAGVAAAALPDTGVIGKAVGTFIADTIRPGGSEIITNLFHAGHEALSGGSIKLFKSQVKILKSVDLEEEWENYSGILHPSHTIAMYTSPKEENDNTVKVGQAYLGHQKFLARFCIPLQRIELPFAHHADTEEAIRVGTPWLKESVARIEDLYSPRKPQ